MCRAVVDWYGRVMLKGSRVSAQHDKKESVWGTMFDSMRCMCGCHR